jgi:hypothetical protein
MDFDKLIDKHFGTMMSHKAASIQHYIETGQISGTFRNSLRHMLSDAMSEGKKLDTGESNCTIDSVRQRILGWWETLPENLNGENSKYQLAYKYYDRHWMSLTYREIEYIYGQYVA